MRPNITSLEELLRAPSNEFGTVIDLDYNHVTFATNDATISAAGGIPQRSFLLVAPTVAEDEVLQEVILVAVKDRTRLSQDSAFQTIKEDLAIRGGNAEHDPRTQQALNNLAFTCEIIGTFYRTPDGIKFGGDLDRIRGNSLFKVYKPRGKALSYIASFSNNKIDPAAVLDLGTVRFSETQLEPDPDARMYINIKDFIGKKSAVLAMTRAGKSNSIKIIAKKTFEYAKATNTNIGQLIFDPQGEYANTNVQDGEALANISDAEDVRIYKVLRQDELETDKVKHLQFNLFEESNIQFLWKLMLKNLSSGMSAGTNYIAALEGMKFYRPGKNGTDEQKELWNQQMLGVYALAGASMAEPKALKNPFTIFVGDEEENVEYLHDHLRGDGKGNISIENTEDARVLLEHLMDREGQLDGSLRKALHKGILTVFKEQLLAQKEGRNGVMAAFRRVEQFHNDQAVGDVRKKIWADMAKGRIVIVDLSKGSPKSTQTLSELIVESLVGKASDRFTKGESMVPFQIVVEEAHNLFGRNSKDDDAVDPWVRISKEASKYQIGLIYATQEVTSVDTKILSNTSNWIIGHLNSKIETAELSKYYQFADWADHLRKVETKGFVRMKNESSPYIVPVQIDLFQVKTEADPFEDVSTPVEFDEMPDMDDLEDMF